MPGIDARAPERTDTSSGRSGSPSLRAGRSSSRARPASTWGQSPAGSDALPDAWYAAQASVVIVKPGGTGMPRFVISASSQPLPPRRSRIALEPSAFPAPKE